MKKLWNLILGTAHHRTTSLYRAEERARTLNATRRLVSRPQTTGR